VFQFDVRLRGDGGIAVKTAWRKVPGSVCAPCGFKAAAVFCDIKRLGTGKGSEKGKKRDLALIVSDVPAAVAGMFTANQVCAAPVKVSAKNAARKFARGIVVNSGNANACTGEQGRKDAEEMTRVAASVVAAVYDPRNGKRKAASAVIDRRYRKIAANEFLVCSTGRIGVPMPMANVKRGIADAAKHLTRSPGAARAAAEAIMTSDTRRKEIAVEFKMGGVPVRIGGICKGAGMIQPQMAAHATMLGFITTDAAVESNQLKPALESAVAQSFNRITVDGDMSTNDTAICLANGQAGIEPIEQDKEEYGRFSDGLNFVTRQLARMIVEDGEGVTKFVEVHVKGASTYQYARKAAQAVANSTLVKCAWFGEDPNWGRVMDAVGYSSAKVREEMIDIFFNGAIAVQHGMASSTPQETLTEVLRNKKFTVTIDLHLGSAEYKVFTTDLTPEYVKFNMGE